MKLGLSLCLKAGFRQGVIYSQKRRIFYVKNQIIISTHHKIIFILGCILVIAGCANVDTKKIPIEVPEIHPGILAGYLQQDSLPNSLALIPPPPAQGSAALAFDEEVSRKALALRDTPRWELSIEDANLMFPEAAGAFSCALGIPITEQDTPHLYMLLRRSAADAGLSTYTAKKHYQRKRPFMINGEPVCTPEEEEGLRKDGSYPSGHTALGWAWALILTEIAPDRADAILARGRAFGESRNVCNVHWHSDVAEGRFMGAATVAKLHANPAFRDEIEAAKTEFAAVRARGLKSTRDCQAEADALTYRLDKQAIKEAEHAGEVKIILSWHGDYPIAQLQLLPEMQREQGVGFIDDSETFTKVWKAFKPDEDVPEIDFKSNLVLFVRNKQFYNSIRIGKVNLNNGVAELLAMETMSAIPIENKVSMSMVIIPRKGITAIKTDGNIITVNGGN